MELIISMTIVAIVMTVAAPSLSQFIQNRQLTQQTSSVVNALSTARSIALSKAAATTMCWNPSNADLTLPSPDEAINLVSGGLAVIDPSEATTAARVKNQTSFLNDGYNSISDFGAAAAGVAQCVTFDSQGRSATSGNFVICKDGEPEADSITIRLNNNGRTSEVKGNQVAGVTCA